MAAIAVSTTPQPVPSGWTDVQNLGGVDVWAAYDPAVSPATGIKIAAGGSYSRPYAYMSDRVLYVVTASGTADLRVIGM